MEQGLPLEVLELDVDAQVILHRALHEHRDRPMDLQRVVLTEAARLLLLLRLRLPSRRLITLPTRTDRPELLSSVVLPEEPAWTEPPSLAGAGRALLREALSVSVDDEEAATAVLASLRQPAAAAGRYARVVAETI